MKPQFPKSQIKDVKIIMDEKIQARAKGN